MTDNIKYKRDFSLIETYKFLEENNLQDEALGIKNTQEKFKSYNSTLRRAKIIILLKEHNLLDKFVTEVWPSGQTKKGQLRIKFLERLHQRFLDNENGVDDEIEDEELSIEETQFAYETDLRDYLARNLHIIEPDLTLYDNGVEFLIPNTQRRIDILAKDKDDNFVVIELKVSRGHEKAMGQTLYYQSAIRQLFKVEKVRVIIIAREISEEIKVGTMYLSDFKLFEYQLSLTLNQIK